MLQKMGWKEDKGLGKEESGMVDSIKIQKREIGIGLGMEGTTDRAGKGWSETANSFNAVLDILKQSYSKEKSKKNKVKKSSSDIPNISVGMK